MSTHWDGAEDFYSAAEREMFPLLQSSKMVISLLSGEPDAKSCIELGAAIMFNKPIIVVSFGDVDVPQRLHDIAHAVIHYDEDESVTHGPGAKRLEDAMTSLLAADREDVPKTFIPLWLDPDNPSVEDSDGG